MKKYSTKKALIASILMLAICFTSLIGTTFAWFTDSVTSSGNKIVAGTLDVDLVDAAGNSMSGKMIKWDLTDGDTRTQDQIYWEPGCTYKTEPVKVANKGNLAIKYVIAISGIDGDAKLLEAIEWTVTVGGVKTAVEDLKGSLVAGTAGNPTYSDEIVLSGHMKEEAGNEYMGLTVEGISITVLATQATVENDSFDNQYDADAWHPAMPVYTAEELNVALINAKDGDVIALAGNIECDDGFLFTNKNVTVDLNGKTLSVSNGSSTNNRVFKINGTSNVTIKNGTLVAEGDLTSGAYGTIRTEGSANVTLENVKMYNYRGGGLNVKAYAGTTVTLNNCEIYSQYGGGVEAAGGNVELNGTKIVQEGVYSGSVWCSVAIGVNGNGKVVVNSGTYSAHPVASDANAARGTWVAYVMNSGGELEINGGTFNGTTGTDARGIICADTAAVVEINEGTFNSTGAILHMCNNLGTLPNPEATIAGGTFSANPTVSGGWNGGISIADGFQAVEDGDRYIIINENYSVVSGYPGLYTDGANYYVYTAEGLISMRNYWAANSYSNHMWGCSYNIMDNIDATGYTWNEVYVVVGNNANNGFILDGHGNTITGLTINGSMFTGTPNGGNAGTAPGEVKDITFDGVTVNGGHWTAVVWGNTYGEIVFENVNVINSTISGKCNTAAFVGGTCQESGDVTVTFKNCAVKNTTISANGAFSGVVGDWASDPNGANVYISRAYNKAYVVFEGENVSENNTVTNVNGVTGGGIYGYVALVDGWWASIGTSESFTNWNGLVFDAEDVSNILANGGDVTLADDVNTEAATTAPYGNKYAVALNGGTLDGNGNELYMECYGDDYGIMTTGGTIKNLTIKEGCRAIMIMYANEDIIIDNVNVGGDGVLYPINTGEAGDKEVKLVVTNSTIAGWTSYGVNIASASFTNVKFEQGTYYNNIYGRVLKPYVNTTLEDCSFVAHMNLDLSSLAQGQKVTISNCTVDGQAITINTFTIPTTDAQYDTELFTVDLPAWATSISDCVEFK